MKTEKSGGRPKKQTSGFEKEKTIGFQNTKTKLKPNVNDNVNENENDNVNGNENASALYDADVEKINNLFIETLGSTNLSNIKECISYLDKLSVEVIEYALKKTARKNANWDYAMTILDSYFRCKLISFDYLVYCFSKFFCRYILKFLKPHPSFFLCKFFIICYLYFS